MPYRLSYGQVQRSAMNWPFFAAAELDLFTEQDLVIEANIYTAPPDPVTALIRRSLDVINVIPDVTLIEMVKGAPLALIANTNSRAQYRLVANDEIGGYQELEGKKIGVNDGRSAESLILKRLLKKNGLQAGSYELVASGPPLKRCDQLRQRLIAATMVTEPFHFLLAAEGCKVLGSSLDVAPDYPFTVCVVRREEKVREDIMRFLQCLNSAWQWLSEPSNRERAVAILSRSTGTPIKHAEATYDLYLSPPAPPTLAPTENGVTTVLDLLAESGRISRPFPLARKYIDGRYYEKL